MAAELSAEPLQPQGSCSAGLPGQIRLKLPEQLFAAFSAAGTCTANTHGKAFLSRVDKREIFPAFKAWYKPGASSLDPLFSRACPTTSSPSRTGGGEWEEAKPSLPPATVGRRAGSGRPAPLLGVGDGCSLLTAPHSAEDLMSSSPSGLQVMLAYHPWAAGEFFFSPLYLKKEIQLIHRTAG